MSKGIDYYLPDESDEDGKGRTGILSTYVEWHALGIGVAVGMHSATSGDLQTLSEIMGLVTAGSRIRKGLPDKYAKQVAAELPHFILGVVTGYVVSKHGPHLAGVVPL